MTLPPSALASGGSPDGRRQPPGADAVQEDGPARSAALMRVACLALIAWLLICLAVRFA